jgi:hypothetical protein
MEDAADCGSGAEPEVVGCRETTPEIPAEAEERILKREPAMRAQITANSLQRGTGAPARSPTVMANISEPAKSAFRDADR